MGSLRHFERRWTSLILWSLMFTAILLIEFSILSVCRYIIPLKTHEGFNLGTLCVLDTVPRTPSETDVAQLGDLAAVVMDELELRLAARKAVGNYHEELVRRELREDHIKGLMRELAHRSKNLLSVVQAMTRQTMPDDATSQRYATRLGNRIQALAQTHDRIDEEEWRGAKLDELAHRSMRGISSRPRAAAPTEGLSQTTRNLKSAAVAADFFIADLIFQRRYVPHLPPRAAPYHCVPARGALVMRRKPLWCQWSGRPR
jgi:hypothetical protein